MARGHAEISPLPEFKPKLPPQQTPYVYSHAELQSLLNATAVLKSALSHLRPQTYRTLLLILYGAGLRISEAIRLTVVDVDLTERLLTIRKTKFYKSRLVPIGVQLAEAMTAYFAQRCTLPMPKGQESNFLCSRSGCHLTYQSVVTQFQRIRSQAGIKQGLHDLPAIDLVAANAETNLVFIEIGHQPGAGYTASFSCEFLIHTNFSSPNAQT
jgi:integrase/recombinase XerD